MCPYRDPRPVGEYSLLSARRAGVGTVLLLVAAHLTLKSVFFSKWFLREVALPVESATGGLLSPAALAGSIQLVVLVGFGVLVCCRMSTRDIGLRLPGSAISLTLLAIIFTGAWLACAAVGATVSYDKLSPASAMGRVLEATVGSAVGEELFYRGFLLSQVYLLLRHWRGDWTSGRTLAAAIAAVQVYFALNHLPAAMRAGLSAETATLWLLHAALVGAMFAVLYLHTGSLVLSIGAHALLNLSIPFLDSPVDPALFVLVLVCIAMLAGPWLFSRERDALRPSMAGAA